MSGFVILIIGFLVLIGIGIWHGIELKNENKKEKNPTYPMPQSPRIKENVPQLKPIADQLEKALPSSYLQNVYFRLSDNFTTEKWQYAEVELKHYFILNRILKQVSMYSDDVDALWHQMILFTRQYQSFCQNFFGEFLHHEPHVGESVPKNPTENRLIFDLAYTVLFKNGESTKLWGEFFRQKVDKELIEEWRSMTEKEWIERYFRYDAETKELVGYMLQKIKEILREAYKKATDLTSLQKHYKIKKKNYLDTNDEELIILILAFSMLNDTVNRMNSGNSNCSAYLFDQYTSGNDSHSSNCSSSSCSSSSCSSSSCSSCGGGGD